jgi:hypothetical protein
MKSREPPATTHMKLKELKTKVFSLWADYTRWYGKAIAPVEAFKPEIRSQFGDLRKRSTWEAAYCRYSAMVSQIGLLDAYRLILNDFNFTPTREDYQYRHRIFDEWLMLPDGLDLIKLGLEQLFSTDFTPQEREHAHGFFELVQESTRGELAGITTRSIGQLTASTH